MRPFSQIAPKVVKTLFLQLLIVVGGLFVTRLIFFFYNSARFPSLTFLDFVFGTWIDVITVCLFFFPYYTLYLLPIPLHRYKWHKLLFAIGFHVINSFLLIANLVDVAYYPFTMKRSTRDIFGHLFVDNDLSSLSGSFLIDFWWLILVFIILFSAAYILYKRIEKPAENLSDGKLRWIKKRTVTFFVIVPMLFLIARGGIRPKPIGIIDTVLYANSPENAEFILNTPFSLLKTVAVESIDSPHYFSEKEARKYFNPIKETSALNILPDNTNVVIIVLESFGIEYVGHYNKSAQNTPFLDSLLRESLTIEYAFANGKKSVDAIPAIVSSIPSLMNEPFLASSYANNRLESIPKSLKKHNYTSAFFHGATNGSMRFDAFAKQVGFEHYFGRKQFNNDEYYDGTWGIFDHYFNPWSAKKMSELKQPFFSLLFTVSSHHPYTLPEEFIEHQNPKETQIEKSIQYGDFSLSKFFEEAQKQAWFENTLFVITADHSPSCETPIYCKRSHLYRIPLALYHPKIKLDSLSASKLAQQADIFPTILELLNIETEIYSVGKSIFSEEKAGVLNFNRNSLYYFKNNHLLTFYDGKAQKLINFTLDDKIEIDSLEAFPTEAAQSEKEIKSLTQLFFSDLKKNVTWTE